jgi:hypothetical protein
MEIFLFSQYLARAGRSLSGHPRKRAARQQGRIEMPFAGAV